MNKQLDNRLVYSIVEVAQMLGLSQSTVYLQVENGSIPSLRFGNRIVVPRNAFDKLMSSTALEFEAKIQKRKADIGLASKKPSKVK